MNGPRFLPAVVALACLAVAPPRLAAASAEEVLRGDWVGRWVVLRTEVQSDCEERYTNNRIRGPLLSSGGRHRFAPGELGRVDNLHVQRSRVDLLVSLDEPLRVELRDGPFQLFEHRECRVELQLPAPRSAVRSGNVAELDALIRAVAETPDGPPSPGQSALWNERRVEPLPTDHEERLAAYHAWKQEQLYLALRGRLAEALDRAADIARDVDRGAAYAQGLALGARDYGRDRHYSAACEELPAARFHASYGKAPKELDDRAEQDWKDGFEDGQRLLFEISLARRIERCLP